MSTSEVEGKFSSKLKLPIRIWKDLKETTVGSLAYVSVSSKSGNFCGEFKCRPRCRSSYVVGCGRSSLFNSCFQRPQKTPSRLVPRQWEKGRQASATSCYTSPKTGFFDRFCLVLFDSVLLPTQPFCSLRVSQYNFQIFFPFKMRF